MDQETIDRVGRVLRKAVASGVVSKPSVCSKCGVEPKKSKDLHGHHPDYSKPLEVIWLCSKCHRHRHMFENWFEICFDWLKYCKEEGMDPREGRLPCCNPKTGAQLKKTWFDDWLRIRNRRKAR